MYRVTLFIFFAFISIFECAAQEEEVLLTFKHPATGRVYINSIYEPKNNLCFLPIMEIFSLLEIHYRLEPGNLMIKGTFLTEGQPYTIDLEHRKITLGEKAFDLEIDDFRMGSLDYYIHDSIYEKVFGLKFSVDMSYLICSLETGLKMPVEERLSRESNRLLIGDKEKAGNFPLKYGLKRSLFQGGMLDYSLTGSFSENARIFNYSVIGGLAALGGDFQGAVTGTAYNHGHNSYFVTGMKWRYVILDNRLISCVTAGQVSTTGAFPVAVNGIWISNDPIEPREIYESYVIDGLTEPESEVEVYLNDQLIDYMRTDETGYYRFILPVMYGSTEISLRIYTPTGDIRMIDRKMQVPFTFLPPKKFSYNFQSGYSYALPGDSSRRSYISHLKLAYGATRWMTVSAGAQKSGTYMLTGPVNYYGSLSLRARQYLFNADLSPGAFYRFTGSVVYQNNINLNAIYTRYRENNPIMQSSSLEELQVDLYLPFKVFDLQSGFRLDGGYSMTKNGRMTRYSADYNITAGSLNLRLNYRDNLLRTREYIYYGEAILTPSLTYTMSRSTKIPGYIKGMYIRGQLQYDIRHNKLKTAEIRLSQSLLKKIRFNVVSTYSFVAENFNLEFGLTLELAPIRSITTVNVGPANVIVKEGLYGSVGIDTHRGHFECSRRQQVGKAAASVILFIDVNSSGKYEPGEELLPNKGIYLDKSSNMEIGKDSILRITQLNSYYLYNLSVNRNAIADPTLVPMIQNFSFIADPNQYKCIEIPFYRGGTVLGTVVLDIEGHASGIGGLRLLLSGTDNTHKEVLRTFNDGSFYIMDLAPGHYQIVVDSDQLGFLNVPEADTLAFEIKTLAEGDYIENLKIMLKNEQAGPVETKMENLYEIIPLPENIQKEVAGDDVVNDPEIVPGKVNFTIQAGAFIKEENAEALRDLIISRSGADTEIVLCDGMFKVQITNLTDRKTASQVLKMLNELGIDNAFITGR